MWSLCTLLAGVCVSCWLVPAVRGTCTDAQVKQCLKPLLIAEQPNAVIPWYSKAVVVDNCRRFQSFATCMKDITPSCTLTTQLVIQGIENSYNYMCNEGFDEYVLHQPCFADPHVQDEAASCNATFNEKLNSLASINDTAYKRARICQYADNYIDCIGNVLKSFCGQSAASWQRTYDQKQLCPTLTAYGCPGWSEQCGPIGVTTQAPKSTALSWYMILVIVAIIVSVIIIVTSIVILVALRLSRRRPRTDDERPPSRRRSLIESLGGIDMPPPYPGPFIPAAAAAVNFGLVLDESCASAGGASAASGGADDASAAGGGDDVEKKRVPADLYAGEGHFVPDSTDMDAKLAQAIPPPSYGRHRHHHRKSIRIGAPAAAGAGSADPGGSDSTPTTISDADSSLTFARRTMTPDVIEAALGLAEGGACGGRGTAAAAAAPRADGAYGLAGYISESDMGSFGDDTFSSGYDGLPTVLRCVSHQSGYSADFIDEDPDHRDVSYKPHDDYY